MKAYERYNETIGAARQLTLPLDEPSAVENGNSEVKVEIPGSSAEAARASLRPAMPSPEGSSVTFRRVPASLRRTPIERFARTLQKEVAKGRPFDALITGDTELRRLNRDFRGKDYATDVLSFPSEPLPSEPRPSGSGLPRRHRDFAGPRTGAGARVPPLHRARSADPDAAWRAAPAGPRSRDRFRGHGARRKALAPRNSGCPTA